MYTTLFYLFPKYDTSTLYLSLKNQSIYVGQDYPIQPSVYTTKHLYDINDLFMYVSVVSILYTVIQLHPYPVLFVFNTCFIYKNCILMFIFGTYPLIGFVYMVVYMSTKSLHPSEIPSNAPIL